MKNSDAEVTEAINLYKVLPYGPEDQQPDPPQQDWLPTNYERGAYHNTIQDLASREIDCFTIALGKKTGKRFQ